MTDTKHITITKTVPVNDLETLTAWLNTEMNNFLTPPKRDGGKRFETAGAKAIELIKAAGFDIRPPRVKPEYVEYLSGDTNDD